MGEYKDVYYKNWEEVNKQHRQYYQDNKTHLRTWMDQYDKEHPGMRQVRDDRLRQRRADRYAFVNDYKQRVGCACCGIKEPIVLQFHHLDSSSKIANIATYVSNPRIPLETIEDELKKCVVLCANCHFLLHAGKLTIGGN